MTPHQFRDLSHSLILFMDKTTKGHEIWALNYLDTQMISQLLLPELQQICEDREASLYLLVHLVDENDLYKNSRQQYHQYPALQRATQSPTFLKFHGLYQSKIIQKLN